MASSSEIEKLERRYAENPDGRFFAPLADAYRKANQLDRALELVRAGLTKHPDYLSAHIVLGRCLLDKGTDAEAAATFQGVLGMDAENIIALKSLSEIAERGGRLDEARSWLQKLLAVDSMNAEAEADLQRLGGPLAEPAAPAEAAVAEAVAPETSFADVAREMAAEPVEAAAPPAVAETAPSASEETTLVVEAHHPPAAAPVAESAPVAEVPAAAPPPPLPRLTPLLPMPGPGLPERTTEPIAATAAVGPEPPAEQPPVAAAPPLEAIALDLVEEPAASAAAAAAPPKEPAPVKPDIHPLPSEARVSSEALEVMPFDDSLAWGPGERSSRAIRSEDVQGVMHDAQVETPAIEFLSGMGMKPPDEPAAFAPPPAEAAPAAAAPAADDFTIEPPPDQSFAGVEVAQDNEIIDLPANLSGAYSLVDEAPPPPVAAGPAAPHDLPLIMPEDVTPPEELARPSAKVVQMVSPPPREEPAAHPPMATETMGDLYLKQGFRAEAAEVYRRLLAQRSGDAALAAKLRAAEGPPPDLRAASLGLESVGTWLKRVAGARLSTAAAPPPAAPPPPPPVPSATEPPALSPLEAAFSQPEPDGEPAHAAPDAFSLDQIFGGSGETAPPAAPPAPEARATSAPPLGASFDEFFGPPGPPAAPSTAPAVDHDAHPHRPPAPSATRGDKPAEPANPPVRPSRLGDEDLTAFSAWLQGLKK